MGLDYFSVMGMGPDGWGLTMLLATGVTLAAALCGFLIGSVFGTLLAWAKLSDSTVARVFADSYTTLLRGVPDLLVIYLFYFGGSLALSAVGRWFGTQGFVGLPAFATGVLALGFISGAYQTEVFRGAFKTLAPGEIEAAKAVGMPRLLMFRRIVAPQVLRFAIPGLGNVWQMALKESALLSVTGLVELLRQSQTAAGSTGQPFSFFVTAAALYLAVTTVSNLVLERAEKHALRGVRGT